MRAYKQLTTKDVVITPFDAMKGFGLSPNECTGSTTQVEFYQGYDLPYIGNETNTSGQTSKKSVVGVYHSVKQMYYTNYISSSQDASGSTTVSTIQRPVLIPGVQDPNIDSDRTVGVLTNPRYENYLQSTIPQVRFIQSSFHNNTIPSCSVISIPSKLYGENIVPTTFEMRYTGSGMTMNNILGRWDVKDDGEGNLYYSQSLSGQGNKVIYVGNIFYSHGIITFTSGGLENFGKEMNGYLDGGLGSSGLDNNFLFYSSSYRLYEHSYECTAGENEFTYTQNPTSLLNKSVLSTEKDALLSSITYFQSNVNFSPGTYTDLLFQFTGGSLDPNVVSPQFTATIVVGGTIQNLTLDSITVQYAGFPSTPNNSDNSWKGYTPGQPVGMIQAGYPQIQLELQPEAFTNFSFDQSTYRNDMTGSYFSPYLTTVGLYDDNKQLLAVGKLSNPTPISKFSDTTVLVNFDIS